MNGAFILRLILAAAFTYGVYFFLSTKLPANLVYHNYHYILFFFTLLTAFFHNGLSKSAKSGTKHFIRFYMAATGIKLLLYIGVIILYALINKPGAMGFALCFLIHYCIFTVFEVAMAYQQFGNMKKETTGEKPE